jgi:hypothetical protein
MTNAIQEMREAFRDSFMQPEAFKLEEGTFLNFYNILAESGLDLEEGAIYARLSASGYLDCTEWSGPFETLEQAAQHLIDTYAE